MAGTLAINVTLMTSIPVLIVYGTATVQENEEVHFFRDIYGRDAALVRALDDVSDLRATVDCEPW